VSERIRVAVAGLGAVAQAVHLPLLTRRWDLFDLVAVCDLSPSLRADVGARYGVPEHRRYDDIAVMLADTEPDGILLLTSGSHGGPALAALTAGVAVFCEKPLALTVAQADALAAAEADAGQPRLLLGYMKEFDDAVARAEQDLRAVGEVRAVDVTVLHPSTPSQLAFANLRPPPSDVPTEALDRLRTDQEALTTAVLGHAAPAELHQLYANVVLGSLVHHLSLVRSLCGGLEHVDTVRAWPAGAQPGSVEITGWVSGGARARLAWHYLEDYPDYTETLSVHGATGSLTLTFGVPYLLNAPAVLSLVGASESGAQRMVHRSRSDAFEHELAAFHDMVVHGKRPRAGIAEGRADIITAQRVLRRHAEQSGIALDGEARHA
jgi:myo-inositol 2-dehydrogenase/D-chiro-inositol 1-dehydrogenase